MCGVRRGYVARRELRRERWTEDLSFCFGLGEMLGRLAGVPRKAKGAYSFLNIVTVEAVLLLGCLFRSGESFLGGDARFGVEVELQGGVEWCGEGANSRCPAVDGGVNRDMQLAACQQDGTKRKTSAISTLTATRKRA